MAKIFFCLWFSFVFNPTDGKTLPRLAIKTASGMSAKKKNKNLFCRLLFFRIPKIIFHAVSYLRDLAYKDWLIQVEILFLQGLYKLIDL